MLTTDQAARAAKLLRENFPDANDVLIIAEDLNRLAEAANGHPTIETFHAELALSNDRALSDERLRVVIRGAATNDADVEDVGAADALRDWLRDEIVPIIIEGARYRAMRQIGSQDDRTGVPPESARLAEGMELFVSEMASLAVQGIDFLDMARDVLDCFGGDDSYREHVAVFRALNAAYPNDQEPGGEVDAGTVVLSLPTEIEIDVPKATALLHELSRMGLAGDRFVGGTSVHLFHPTKGS